MTTTIRITGEDIRGIAAKLEEFSAVLTDRERTVFLGVLGLAGQELRDKLASGPPSSATPTASSLPSLSEGFRSAFEPGVGGEITVGEGGQAEEATFTAGVTYKF